MPPKRHSDGMAGGEASRSDTRRFWKVWATPCVAAATIPVRDYRRHEPSAPRPSPLV